MHLDTLIHVIVYLRWQGGTDVAVCECVKWVRAKEKGVLKKLQQMILNKERIVLTTVVWN